MSKGFWVCFVLTLTCWIGALVNGVLYLIEHQGISLAAFFFVSIMAAFATYNTMNIYRIERK